MASCDWLFHSACSQGSFLLFTGLLNLMSQLECYFLLELLPDLLAQSGHFSISLNYITLCISFTARITTCNYLIYFVFALPGLSLLLESKLLEGRDHVCHVHWAPHREVCHMLPPSTGPDPKCQRTGQCCMSESMFPFLPCPGPPSVPVPLTSEPSCPASAVPVAG